MFMIGVEQNIVWTKCVTFAVCYVESSTVYNLSQHKHPVTRLRFGYKEPVNRLANSLLVQALVDYPSTLVLVAEWA